VRNSTDKENTTMLTFNPGNDKKMTHDRWRVDSGAVQTLALYLTGREREVLRLVAQGQTDRKIAESLVISPRTVNRHLSNIFVKLEVPGRAAAVAYAVRQGLV
jgi:DNA-binding CsgD family transcriptional regulator